MIQQQLPGVVHRQSQSQQHYHQQQQALQQQQQQDRRSVGGNISNSSSHTMRRKRKHPSTLSYYGNLIFIFGLCTFLLLSVALFVMVSVTSARQRHPQYGNSPLDLASSSSAGEDTAVNTRAIAALFRHRSVVLLSTADRTRVSTDVRGNLGPAAVLLQNGTDWLQDRWQAASDMHGTNIAGSHWVQLDFIPTVTTPVKQDQQQRAVVLTRIVLDWEAAYSDDYEIQVQPMPRMQQDANNNNNNNVEWKTIFKSTSDSVSGYKGGTIRRSTWGKSPGVVQEPGETVTPLHVLHDITLSIPSSPTQAMRVWIHSSATGWGVSLWQVSVYGYHYPDLDPNDSSSSSTTSRL